MSTSPLHLYCPTLDFQAGDRVTLAHGEGGLLMRKLIRDQIVAAFPSRYLQPQSDAAILPRCENRLAMTSDSFVVSPLFFPGGDIGSLAVYGTANDLAVAGARPLWISLAFILEEGLELEILRRTVASIAAAAARAGVQIATGDTKVVPHGAADQLFINTTGIGEVQEPLPPGPEAFVPGDELLVTGPIGQHGMAVMTAREGFAFDPPPSSDSAPLTPAVEALRAAQVPMRACRDATRGGVAAVLHEWAEASRTTLAVEEAELPVSDEVRGACELLGLDPIHVANEGTMVVAVEPGAGEATRRVLREVAGCTQAAVIGRVEARSLTPVVVERLAGARVALDEPAGAPLPRIC